MFGNAHQVTEKGTADEQLCREQLLQQEVDRLKEEVKEVKAAEGK